MKILLSALSLLLPAMAAAISIPADSVKTTMQTSRGWRPSIDVRTDAVMVYGVGGNPSDRRRGHSTIEERIASWRDKGYTVHFMTGIAWGEYQDYFTGAWDGKRHLDEGQKVQRGDTIWHGYMVPYIVPSENFIEYMKQACVKRAIDAGAEAIFLEEPEFWARSGYSDAFKREWQDYYGTPWRPQHESPEATYLSGKLKYHLYYRALNEVMTFAKDYGRSLGKDIKCYVPTHSLVNYSMWEIVSPEASLASLPCVDGYIAQVWTGTSRSPVFYNGRQAERVFETAFLEYGSMESMTAPTGRKMFFLTDPIEDLPRDWEDYRRNYQATFTAQLLYPGVADYEVMPWPERIYEGLYHATGDKNSEMIRIPRFYSTQMQVMVNALNRMPRSDNRVSGTHGVGVLMGNSLMFQRFPRHEGYDDPQLSNFFGLALPLLKRGMPVSTVHIENLGYPATLSGIKVLAMTYANMKPLSPEAHEHLARWVRDGGKLIYSGSDSDPFQKVDEWWSKAPNAFSAPSQHLFKLLGLDPDAPEGTYSVGKGAVTVLRTDPKHHVMDTGGDQAYLRAVERLFGSDLGYRNNFTLRRGPYLLAAVLDESVTDEPLQLRGHFISLFDPGLPVSRSVTVAPGSQALLLDVDKVTDRKRPQILAASFRESDESVTPHSYTFTAKSPADTDGIARILLPKAPKEVTVDGVSRPLGEWDKTTRTYLLKLPNSPAGHTVTLRW